MINSKKQSFIVIGVFALVLMLGTVTYAFFNYTRTGSANTIRTGRISFNTSQSNTLNLTNVFPMSEADAGNANLDAVSVRIQGDTTYANGEEFEISIVGVNNTVNNKTIPINYIASYSATPVQEGDPNVIGTNSDSYFTTRGQSSAVYQLKTTGEATNGEQVLIGYIPSGSTGIDGTLTIKAYLDSSKIAISDTYPEGTVRSVKTSGYSSSDCQTALTGVANASTYCASASSLQSAIDNSDLTSGQIALLVNAGIVEEYTNGTPASFGTNKEVFTTNEWNSLQQNGVSFQVKVEANEGIWVDAPPIPLPTMDEMCPGCVYVTPWSPNYYYYGENGTILNEGDYSINYEDVLTDDNWTQDAFFGVILDNSTGRINRVFLCNHKRMSDSNEKVPYCLEGVSSGDERLSEVEASNERILNIFYGENACARNSESSYDTYSCEDEYYDADQDRYYNAGGSSTHGSSGISVEVYDEYGVWGDIYDDQFYHSM